MPRSKLRIILKYCSRAPFYRYPFCVESLNNKCCGHVCAFLFAYRRQRVWIRFPFAGILYIVVGNYRPDGWLIWLALYSPEAQCAWVITHLAQRCILCAYEFVISRVHVRALSALAWFRNVCARAEGNLNNKGAALHDRLYIWYAMVTYRLDDGNMCRERWMSDLLTRMTCWRMGIIWEVFKIITI